MSRDPSEPIGRDRVELPCIFIPDGDQGPLPSSAFGRDTVEFRCIFVPGSHDEPRPGYPWVEFGWLTLDPAPTAGGFKRTASASTDAAVAAADQAAARRTTALSPATPASGVSPAGELSRYAEPDIAATVALWHALSDPRATLATLDAVSTTGPGSIVLTDK
jgi:hypothetical protein